MHSEKNLFLKNLKSRINFKVPKFHYCLEFYQYLLNQLQSIKTDYLIELPKPSTFPSIPSQTKKKIAWENFCSAFISSAFIYNKRILRGKFPSLLVLLEAECHDYCCILSCIDKM